MSKETYTHERIRDLLAKQDALSGEWYDDVERWHAEPKAIIQQLLDEADSRTKVMQQLCDALGMSWTHHSTWSTYFPEHATKVQAALASAAKLGVVPTEVNRS